MQPIARCRSAALALALLLGGCGIYRGAGGTDARLIHGIEPRVEDLDFATAAASQNKLVEALKTQAQLGDATLGARDANWMLMLKAGLQLVDGRCDQYLDALFRFNREQRAARKGLTAATAATAGIMGLTGAAGAAISVVATALGLATTLFDANVDSVLFQIEPSALRNVVLQGRQKYIGDLLDRTQSLHTIDNRPDMMIALQGYLTQCSPAAIEANINNAANGSPFAVTLPPTTGAGAGAVSAISTGTPSVGLLGRATLSQNEPRPPPSRPAPRFRSPLRIPGADGVDATAIDRMLDVLGVAPNASLARAMTAIEQAQRGAGRHDGRYLAEPRGTLEGPFTKSLLLTLGRPMPAQFHTPFERFLLGDRDRGYAFLDRSRLLELRAQLNLPAAGADPWDGVRARLAALRADRGVPPPVSVNDGVSDRQVLDAALDDAIDPRAPAPVQPSTAPGAVQ